jgi:uncharacterized protein (TIGR03437 family)
MQITQRRGRILPAGFFCLALCAAQAQPSIDHVSNAASYVLAPPASEPADTPLPNSAIAQGSLFVIFGSGLASNAPNEWNGYPLPTTLAGTSVAITVGNVTTAALIFYAGPSTGSFTTQVDAVMPSGTPPGSGTLVVTYNGASSAPFPVTVAGTSPGVFSKNATGTGPGVFFNVASDGTMTQNTLFNSASPGQIVALFATGLGPADHSVEGRRLPSQEDVRSDDFLVDVWVGSQPAAVRYAGRSSYTGQDEIDFIVPARVSGCYNEVAVHAGPPGQRIVSNFTSLAVTFGHTCADADGIDMTDLGKAVSTNGSANVGAISLYSNYTFLSLDGGAINLPWDFDTVNGIFATFTTDQLNTSVGLTQSPSVNSCAVTPFTGFTPGPFDPILSQVIYLDAGDALSASGPSTAACAPECDPTAVPENSNGDGYFAMVGGATIAQLLSGGGGPPFFLESDFDVAAGTYITTGPGGANVGPFSASIDVVAPLTWNQGLLNNPIPRTQPLTITWSGGDPNGFVGITGIASTYTGTGSPSAATPGVSFQCVAPVSAGSFDVPVIVLQSLPSTTPGSGSLFPTGYLLVGPASGAVKLDPSPTGLDAAYIFYHFIQGGNVPWQ